MLYPDLYILTNDEHWTVTPETHKYAAAAGSFCFVTTKEGEKQDICQLVTVPCVKRSLSLDEVIMITATYKSAFRVKLTVRQEICWNVACLLVEKQQDQEPKCGLVHENKRQPRKYEDTSSSLQERHTSSENPGLTMRFLTSLI